MEEESTNTLLRSTSHPLTRALGEAPEGSALAEKQDMRLPLPHHQPQQASGSPWEGRQPLLPVTPTPGARFPRDQDGVAALRGREVLSLGARKCLVMTLH